MLSSSSSTITSFFSKTLIKPNSLTIFLGTTMSLNFHAFAGNPIRSRTPKPSEPLSSQSAFQNLKTLLSSQTSEPLSPYFKVLPFRKGRPLAGYYSDEVKWHIGWLSLWECKEYLENSEVVLSDDSLVYLGCGYEDEVVYWGIDVSDASGLVNEMGARNFCFVELRTLMVATDWADSQAMAELAIAGHKTTARALIEWHNTAHFCGHCGGKSVSVEAGRRRQCSNELCKRMIYPRLDPVVIMLVIDKENDRALLSRQSRFIPRMWSCLAGFIEGLPRIARRKPRGGSQERNMGGDWH
ncbi:hypothetical protein OROMI_018704 [Orobanche minor]